MPLQFKRRLFRLFQRVPFICLFIYLPAAMSELRGTFPFALMQFMFVWHLHFWLPAPYIYTAGICGHGDMDMDMDMGLAEREMCPGANTWPAPYPESLR